MRWILIIVFVSLLGSLGIWWWFSNYRPSGAPESPETTESGISLFGNLFTQKPGSGGGGGEGTARGGILTGRGLEQITPVPVAGYALVTQGSTTLVRYVERETGHVYEARYPGGAARRISNTTLPRVKEALFNQNLSLIALRYLRDDDHTIENFVARIASSTPGGEGELVGSFTPQDVDSFVFAPSGNDYAYLMKDASGAIVSRNVGSGADKTLWTSPLREWTMQWTSGGLLLTTKPSFSAQGFSYILNIDTKTVREVAGGIRGLAAFASSDGKKILTSDSSLSLSLVDGAGLLPTGVRTLPEKCVWHAGAAFCAVPRFLPPGNYPDAWHQGSISFSDDLWVIDMDGRTYLADTFDADAPLDAVELRVSPDGRHVFFVNKRDRSLWATATAK